MFVLHAARTVECYGELYRKTEEYDKAMENYKKCLAISIRLVGKESSNVGDVYHSIGAAIREGDGDLDEALELVQMGMATAIRVYQSLRPRPWTCWIMSRKYCLRPAGAEQVCRRNFRA